ncbi:MAG: GNAT family N-acetyltransferase [Putridiphycobacter sp.]|nr:GNAT family N-acetyltransferase [Putridiphycobacter sp.]
MKITEIKNSKKLWPLRNLVLWRHKILLDCGIEADLKRSTFHIGAVDEDDNVLGTSTYINQTNDNFNDTVQYRLRAMATHPSARGKGLGKKMIEKGLDKLKQKKVDIVWCDARIEAAEFYKKMGFQTVGETYDVPDIGPHKLMYYRIDDK